MPELGETSVEILRARGAWLLPTPQASLLTLPGFIPPLLCVALRQRIDAKRRPSTIADPNGDHYFRTSETCDLRASDPAVAELERRLLALNGIDPAHGEPPQGQRYAPGQEFKAHTDYFEPDGPDYQRFCGVAGQRTWTFMVYLNDVEAGGETCFNQLDVSFRPEPGRLVCWDNRLADKRGNPATIHHALPVTQGVKYVITKWYREQPWGW